MLAIKRSGEALRRSSKEKKRTCTSGKAVESLIQGDLWNCKQGVWGELREEVALRLSKSVVSLALCDGDTVLFASSGITIECDMHVSKFLTSASLYRALEKEAKCHDNVEVKVCHNRRTVTGFLEVFDLDYDIAVVKILSSLDVQNVLLHRSVAFDLDSDVVAVGHSIHGEIMALSGKLTCDPRGYEDHECLMFSTCNEAWEGGPLFDFYGAFVGMNLYAYMGNSCFVPKDIIIQRLQHFQTSQKRNLFVERIKDLKTRLTEGTSQAYGDALTDLEYEVLKLLGYPRPSKRGMVLVNSFEQYFGDVYRKDVTEAVWKLLRKKVSKLMSKCVVSLAAFNGSRRFFSCTGVFINWDEECEYNNVSTILTSASLIRNPDRWNGESKIVDGLKIEVRPAKGPIVEGTLIHYNLHYNVALVSVKKKNADSLAICKHNLVEQYPEVVAIGRCFKSGDLMASSGKLVAWTGGFNCKSLLYSTCKTTKIGIGGPLIDLAGNFIGVNFYDPKLGTPAVSCDDIVGILKCLKGEGTSAYNGLEEGDSLNWWPVPEPYWRDEEEPEQSYLSEGERRILATRESYIYINGRILGHM